MSEIKNRIESYAARLDEARTAYYDGRYDYVTNEPVTVSYGRRYAKVCVGSSVHTFIDMTNGDILKAASYKAPAKNGVRGSVLAEDFGLSCVGPYGALYVNGPSYGF